MAFRDVWFTSSFVMNSMITEPSPDPIIWWWRRKIWPKRLMYVSVSYRTILAKTYKRANKKQEAFDLGLAKQIGE